MEKILILADNDPVAADGVTAPLRYPAFRRIWLASLLSNFGLMIQGVGAAWAMTQMTSSADKVALVQTALMLPIMLIAMPVAKVRFLISDSLTSGCGVCSSRMTNAVSITASRGQGKLAA